jgi:hypothetical protein
VTGAAVGSTTFTRSGAAVGAGPRACPVNERTPRGDHECGKSCLGTQPAWTGHPRSCPRIGQARGLPLRVEFSTACHLTQSHEATERGNRYRQFSRRFRRLTQIVFFRNLCKLRNLWLSLLIGGVLDQVVQGANSDRPRPLQIGRHSSYNCSLFRNC